MVFVYVGKEAPARYIYVANRSIIRRRAHNPHVFAQIVSVADVGKCILLTGDIRGKLGSDPAVVALIAVTPGGGGSTVPYAVAANPAAQDLGIRANDLVKQLAMAVDGRGGGKADLAQGSGKNPTGIDAALEAVRSEIAEIARGG